MLVMTSVDSKRAGEGGGCKQCSGHRVEHREYLAVSCEINVIQGSCCASSSAGGYGVEARERGRVSCLMAERVLSFIAVPMPGDTVDASGGSMQNIAVVIGDDLTEIRYLMG